MPWGGHFMPYGPTKFENGQNTGARAVNLQVRANDIKVILARGVRQRETGVPDAGLSGALLQLEILLPAIP